MESNPKSSGPPSTLQEMEDFWRTRLDETRKQYERASVTFRQAAQDFTEKQMPLTDGNLRFRRAIREESAARREYMRALRIFTDLIIHGKIPEDE